MQDVTDIFDRSYQATPASVGRVRADIAAFAEAHGVDGTRVDDIRLAVSEAVTNSIVHGYRDSVGTIHVTARYDDSALWISIRDFGGGIKPRLIGSEHAGMGLGLALIGRVVSDLSVAPQVGDGTDVRMRFDLARAGASVPRRVILARV
jgi:anti-sigma regulatory factor (Ser/Thr protein kinase)